MRTIATLFLLTVLASTYAQQPGDLDTSFAVNGLLVIQDHGSVLDITIQSDEKILATTQPYGDPYSTRLIRLHPNGELDVSFGVGGEVAINGLEHVIIQSDNKILCLTTTSSIGTVMRLMPDGTPDTSYTTPPLLLRITSAEIYPDDQLIIGGRYGSGRRFYRLDPDGSLDMSFGDSGSMTINVYTGDYFEEVPGMSIAPNGDCYYVVTRRGPIMSFFPTTTSSIFKLEYSSGDHILLHSMANNSLCPRTLKLAVNDCLLYTLDLCMGGTIQSVSGSITADNWSYTDIPQPPWPDNNGSVGKSDVDQNGNVFIPSPATSSNKFRICSVSACSGTLSSEWGQNGFILTTIPGYGFARARVTKVLPDGKLLVGGGVGPNVAQYLAIARYHNIPDPRSKIDLKMFLGGPYDPNTGLMTDHLRQQSLIPAVQPYSPPTFQAANGVGTWGLEAQVIDLQGDSAIVDWVWLELLDVNDPSLVQATRVGLLHRNGKVTQADGIKPIDFSAGAGEYLLRVRHRNHLSVTLAEPITLGVEPVTVDLTDPNTLTFGTDAQKEFEGIMMLWPGDVNGNGNVKYVGSQNDRDPILSAIGGSTPTATAAGYLLEDVNLDGVVKYVGTGNDRDIILQTIGGVVPTAVRVEQGP